MVRTDRTRKVLWGSLGNRCAIRQGEFVVDGTPDRGESVFARRGVISSPHASKIQPLNMHVGSCFLIRSPNARMIVGI
jgi:hypothetical protein